MYLQDFESALEKRWTGSLFTVGDAEQVHGRAKEYLYRLTKLGQVQRVHWGWYYVPERQDVWGFLAKDKGFKVVIKQTAASIWDYDFVHRDVYRLAVESQSYKKALESFAKGIGWIFEVEFHDKTPYEHMRVDGLFVEAPESCVVSCMSEWAFMDAFATLYFRRDGIDFDKLRQLGRWKRVSKTDTRVWTAIKHGCRLFNEHLGRQAFKVKATSLEQEEVRELIEEAIGRVVEFA